MSFPPYPTVSSSECADFAQVLAELERKPDLKVRRNVPGGSCTTIGIGGTLDVVLEPDDNEGLSRVVTLLADCGIRPHVLGFGSNVLLPDNGLRTVVIRLGKGFRYWKEDGGSIWVGGAMPLMTLSREIANAGRRGLEFAGGIPGSLGGAVFMNAGAHGGEMAQILEEAELVLADGRVVCCSSSNLRFAYRHSALQGSQSGTEQPSGRTFGKTTQEELSGAIVTRARLRLEHDNPEDIASRTQKMLAERKARQPLSVPSLGSVFRNPDRSELQHAGPTLASDAPSAGALIEQMGLKGVVCGGAAISEKHGNWIVSPTRRARAVEFLALVELCESSALHQFRVKLKREFRRLTDTPR